MQKALEYAIKSLIAKRQTEKEIRERLQKRCPDVDPDQIVHRLKELNYIHDASFCEAWIRHRSLNSPRGSHVLRQELRRKGVSQDLIDSSLRDLDQCDILKDLAQRRWDRFGDISPQKRREKLMRFLISRGFSYSEVIEVINDIAQSTES